MNLMRFCKDLEILEKPLCLDIPNENIKKIIHDVIKCITGKNGIPYIIENSGASKNMNVELHYLACNLGTLFGIFESNDKILLNLIDKIYWEDDDTPIELTFVRHLKDDLKTINEDLHKYFTKICPRHEMKPLIEKLEKSNRKLDKRNKYLISLNQDFNYCKASGYISLINVMCDDFITRYNDLNFAKVNEINMQNVSFLIGLSATIVKYYDIKDNSIIDLFNSIFAIIKEF